MKMVKLGDVISIASVKKAGISQFPLLSMTMHNGLMDQSSKFKKRVASSDLAGYKVVSRGQLVVGFPIDEAVLHFQDIYDHAIVSPAYQIWDIKNVNALNSKYLGKFLRSPRAIAYYKAKLRGSTARRRTLPTEIFLDLPVPLPPLEEQRRIAAILDEADELRAKRRAALELLDELPQAIFHDMFYNMPTEPLGEHAGFYSGGTPSRSDLSFWSGSTPWFTPKDFKRPTLKASKENLSDDIEERTNLRILPVNTVAIVVRGMILAHSTPTALLKVPGAINQDVKALSISDSFDPQFLGEALRYKSDWLLERVSTSSHGTKKLDSMILKQLPIPVPTLARQQEFAERIEQVEAQRVLAEKALATADELFLSLQSRAFKGEL